ncbi:MAG: hypothetical protein ACLR71_19245 [[Clostridium] scindens]
MELKLEGNYSLLSTCVYNTIKDAIIAEKLEPGKRYRRLDWRRNWGSAERR